MVPISYGYDDGTVYFTYVLGTESRKRELTERAGRGAFLVYSTESPFTWTSASLSGPLAAVPESEWDDLSDVLSGTWRPDLLASVELSGGTAVYALTPETRSGVKHTGLPPGFEAAPGDGPE